VVQTIPVLDFQIMRTIFLLLSVILFIWTCSLARSELNMKDSRLNFYYFALIVGIYNDLFSSSRAKCEVRTIVVVDFFKDDDHSSSTECVFGHLVLLFSSSRAKHEGQETQITVIFTTSEVKLHMRSLIYIK
jgi:hypothetical protein